MNLPTLIVLLILIFIVSLAIRNIVKKKGNTCGCGCGCEHCKAACSSRQKK